MTEEEKHDKREKKTVLEGDIDLWMTTGSIWSSARNGEEDRLQHLIYCNPEIVHERCRYGDTALHIACTYGQAGCVDILLRHGAKIGVENDDGHTPAMLAVLNLQSRVLKVLSDHNAIPNDQLELLENITVGKGDKASSNVLKMQNTPSKPLYFPPDYKAINHKESLALELKENESYLNTVKPVYPEEVKYELPAPQDWGPNDCIRWTTMFLGFEDQTLHEVEFLFKCYNLTGEVLMRLRKNHLMNLLQQIGVGSRRRKEIVEGIMELRYDEPDDHDKTKVLSGPTEVKPQNYAIVIGIGDARLFKIVTVLEDISPRTTLSEIRMQLKDQNKRKKANLPEKGYRFLDPCARKVILTNDEKTVRLFEVGGGYLLIMSEWKGRLSMAVK